MNNQEKRKEILKSKFRSAYDKLKKKENLSVDSALSVLNTAFKKLYIAISNDYNYFEESLRMWLNSYMIFFNNAENKISGTIINFYVKQHLKVLGIQYVHISFKEEVLINIRTIMDLLNSEQNKTTFLSLKSFFQELMQERILDIGNFFLQTLIIRIFKRYVSLFKNNEINMADYFKNEAIRKKYLAINHKKFSSEARYFLNFFNLLLNNVAVHSIKATHICLEKLNGGDLIQLSNTDDYLWIDFNSGSKSIEFIGHVANAVIKTNLLFQISYHIIRRFNIIKFKPDEPHIEIYLKRSLSIRNNNASSFKNHKKITFKFNDPELFQYLLENIESELSEIHKREKIDIKYIDSTVDIESAADSDHIITNMVSDSFLNIDKNMPLSSKGIKKSEKPLLDMLNSKTSDYQSTASKDFYDESTDRNKMSSEKDTKSSSSKHAKTNQKEKSSGNSKSSRTKSRRDSICEHKYSSKTKSPTKKNTKTEIKEKISKPCEKTKVAVPEEPVKEACTKSVEKPAVKAVETETTSPRPSPSFSYRSSAKVNAKAKDVVKSTSANHVFSFKKKQAIEQKDSDSNSLCISHTEKNYKLGKHKMDDTESIISTKRLKDKINENLKENMNIESSTTDNKVEVDNTIPRNVLSSIIPNDSNNVIEKSSVAEKSIHTTVNIDVQKNNIISNNNLSKTNVDLIGKTQPNMKSNEVETINAAQNMTVEKHWLMNKFMAVLDEGRTCTPYMFNGPYCREATVTKNTPLKRKFNELAEPTTNVKKIRSTFDESMDEFSKSLRSANIRKNQLQTKNNMNNQIITVYSPPRSFMKNVVAEEYENFANNNKLMTKFVNPLVQRPLDGITSSSMCNFNEKFAESSDETIRKFTTEHLNKISTSYEHGYNELAAIIKDHNTFKVDGNLRYQIQLFRNTKTKLNQLVQKNRDYAAEYFKKERKYKEAELNMFRALKTLRVHLEISAKMAKQRTAVAHQQIKEHVARKMEETEKIRKDISTGYMEEIWNSGKQLLAIK